MIRLAVIKLIFSFVYKVWFPSPFVPVKVLRALSLTSIVSVYHEP